MKIIYVAPCWAGFGRGTDQALQSGRGAGHDGEGGGRAVGVQQCAAAGPVQ